MPVSSTSNDYKQPVYNIAEQDKIAQENNNASRVPNDYLGKDAFLQLMIAQMRHQDPLSPMDNADSIAQMAQFSALEQMQNLNTNMQLSRLEMQLTLDDLSEQFTKSQKELVENLNAIKNAIEAYGGKVNEDKTEDKVEDNTDVTNESDDTTETD